MRKDLMYRLRLYFSVIELVKREYPPGGLTVFVELWYTTVKYKERKGYSS
jgi:hypothetical protein